MTSERVITQASWRLDRWPGLRSCARHSVRAEGVPEKRMTQERLEHGSNELSLPWCNESLLTSLVSASWCRLEGGVRLCGSLQQKAGILNIKTILAVLWIKENQISQIKESSTFLCTGRGKSLGSRSHMYLSYMRAVSCVFTSSAPLLLSTGSGCICIWWLPYPAGVLLPECP